MRRNLTYKIKHINVSFFLENANTFLTNVTMLKVHFATVAISLSLRTTTGCEIISVLTFIYYKRCCYSCYLCGLIMTRRLLIVQTQLVYKSYDKRVNLWYIYIVMMISAVCFINFKNIGSFSGESRKLTFL
jgi:hypothetical protein